MDRIVSFKGRLSSSTMQGSQSSLTMENQSAGGKYFSTLTTPETEPKFNEWAATLLGNVWGMRVPVY